jgi:hypothetical protein
MKNKLRCAARSARVEIYGYSNYSLSRSLGVCNVSIVYIYARLYVSMCATWNSRLRIQQLQATWSDGKFKLPSNSFSLVGEK